MRVLLDTSILISYLLTPNSGSPVIEIVNLGFLGTYDLLVAEDLLAELQGKAQAATYLVGRITPEDLRELVDILGQVAEATPRITQEIPAVTRDPKDDYLLAYAMVGRADYLVTGERDLLALGDVEGTRIITARELAEILRRQAS